MKREKLILITLTILICLSSCASGSETSNNAQVYLQGLDAISLEQYSEAIDFFTESSEEVKSASASFATEKLIPLLYEKEDYKSVLEKTTSLLLFEKEVEDVYPYYKVDINFLYRYMLLAMIKLEDPTIETKINEWVENNSFSQEHNTFFASDAFLELQKEMQISEKLLEVISIKSAIYKRDYGQAIRTIVNSANYNKEEPENYLQNLSALLLSDIGKAFLYGTNDNLFFASALEKAGLTYTKKSTEAFMCYFYAGRLYRKEGQAYSSEALSSFEKAMDASVIALDYDTALWYYLAATREGSSRSAITALQEYASTWNDAYYFDDFLDDLAFQLLDNENYKGFVSLYEYLKPYLSPDGLSKYAYISGLLIKDGYVEYEKGRDMATEAFRISYNATEGSLYYRMMASVELNIPSDKVLNALLERDPEKDKEFDNEFEFLLQELIARKHGREAYVLYSNNADIVSVEAAAQISKNLSLVNNPSLENNYEGNFYPESLRVASRAFSQSEKNIIEEDMQLLYPRYYTEIVEQVSQEYSLEEYLIYAIMRSESFFDHDVMSWAGAVGLTQLMPTTAGDVARKLRVKEYDLHNARQNIDFGMFYFDELIPREGVDNSILRALFSYNAGITNVRRWNRQFPELEDNPAFFLEKIPFSETREYGRKILTAAVMYGVLYYDMEVSDVVQAIMN